MTKQSSTLIALVFVMSINCAVAETVLVGTFFNGNSDHLHSRAYIWNPTRTDASIKARAYTLPRSGSSVLMGRLIWVCSTRGPGATSRLPRIFWTPWAIRFLMSPMEETSWWSSLLRLMV